MILLWQSVAMANGEPTGSVSMPGVVVRDYVSADYSACRMLWVDRMLWVELTEHHRRIYEDPSVGGDDPGSAFDYLAEPERVASWVADLDGWHEGERLHGLDFRY